MPLEMCREHNRKKSHFDGKEWFCPVCWDRRPQVKAPEFVLKGNDWPSRDLRRQKYLRGLCRDK